MKLNNIKKWAAALALALGVPAAMYAAVNSGNPALSALELKAEGRNLIQFQPDQTSYEIEVDDISMVTMSAAPVASDATVSISVNGTPYDNHSLTALDGGENTILYTVTTGSQSRTYTIKVKTPVVERYNHFSWKNATVYFVLTDRFYNGDTSNDKSYHRQRPQGNVPDYATFHGGDIKGLTEKLDYLDRLGVNAIWITAPYEQMHGWTGGKNDAFPHYSFHGYYALDWTYIDRNMGTIDEFRNFVTEAHRRGIRVIMDIVLNHTGYSTLDDCVDYDFGNFNGTPTAGWLPSGSKYSMWSPDNAVSFNADSQGKWGNWWAHWVRAFGDRDWATGAGFSREGGDDHTMSLAGLPDVVTEKTSPVAIPPFLKKKWQEENSGDYLNYRLPDVGNWRQDDQGAPADYIINWLAAWVREFGIDGFRCDTAKHVELSRWKQLKETCDAALSAWRSSSRADEYAKNWTDKFWMTGECFGWQHGDTGYFSQGGFDSMINFAFNSSEGSQGRTPSVNDWKYYANFCNGGNGHQVLNYVSSHDTGLHRPGDQKKVATMLLLCPGGAQIYYGDETSRGYMNGCPDQSMSTRSDFNWDAVDNDDNKHWQKIGQFRRRNPAVGAGTQTELGSDTYARTFTDGDYSNAVVIKLNTQNGQSYTVSVGNAFQDGAKVMDGYNTAVTGVVSGGKVTMTASGPVLLIEPYGTIRGVDPPTPPRPQAPVVTANPASGTTFTSTLQVSLTSSDGSPIHYTTSGTANASSTLYTAPLTLSETTTVSTYVANQAGDRVQSFTYTKTDQPVYTMTGDWRELSIYQIMVGSFQHGDGGASGYSDMWGPEGHRKNGNLRGVINALDYIKELGMNAIWLTPIFDSTNGTGGERLQATGYFCTNYFKVDPKFGSEAEFDELIREAHNRGIYVILDGVFGHHGGVSQASPNGNWISTQDNTPNVRGSESGNIQYPGSLDYFKEVIRYWMERGVDGWRLDQCYQVYQGGHNYWNDLRREAEAVANERKARGEKWGTLAYMVGEDWTGAGGITVTQQDGLKSVMDFDGKDNLVNLSNGVGSIGRFLASDAKTRGYRDDGVNPTIFLSNHDTARVGDVVDVNTSPEKLMTRHAAVAAYSGPTCTYYGDEIGDKSGNGNADNKARTSGRISGFNGNEQKVHDYVAKVFNARKANPALWRGSVERDERGNGLEVITKTDSQTGNKVIVIFSQSDANVSIGGTGVDLINGGNVSGSVSVSAWVPAFIKMN